MIGEDLVLLAVGCAHAVKQVVTSYRGSMQSALEA